jgi:hypothetical protein
MSFLIDYFINIVQYIQFFWNYFFTIKNYTIQSAYLFYTRDEESDYEDITYEYKKEGVKGVMREKSSDVADFFFHVEYVYNSKNYVYLTRDQDHVFPPLKAKTSFRLPIKEAFVIDKDGAPVYNVTDVLKMYEGPHVDFHGETLFLRDLNLDDEEEGYRLRLVNVLGKVVEYHILDDSINHQTIWSPSKTSVHPDLQHCT